jgi:hypothetical protein
VIVPSAMTGKGVTGERSACPEALPELYWAAEPPRNRTGSVLPFSGKVVSTY